jgi:hypothetical protein
MGKVFKKLKKVAAKMDFGAQVITSMGLPDPGGKMLFGKDAPQTPAEKAAEAAKTQMNMDRQQADRTFNAQTQQAAQQTNEAAYQAQASAQAMQLANDRRNMESMAAANTAVDTAPVMVDVGTSTADQTKRKKFSAASTNAGEGGPAIRI